MANGEWQMANGEWRTANGKWRMANGKFLGAVQDSKERSVTTHDNRGFKRATRSLARLLARSLAHAAQTFCSAPLYCARFKHSVQRPTRYFCTLAHSLRSFPHGMGEIHMNILLSSIETRP